MSDSVYAPFTAEQVASLNAYQESGLMHPFTCSGGRNDSKRDSHSASLVAGPLGWTCPVDGCTYHQAWAHSFMADWKWIALPSPVADARAAEKPQAVTAVAKARAWLSSDWLQRIVSTPLTEADICALADDAQRLEIARQVLIDDGYFTADQVGKDLAPRLVEWLSHHRRPDAEGVPDLPCPKCGHAVTRTTYCDGCALMPFTSVIGAHADDKCRHGEVEHHHRNCLRCSYRWRTNDVLDARKVCAK